MGEISFLKKLFSSYGFLFQLLFFLFLSFFIKLNLIWLEYSTLQVPLSVPSSALFYSIIFLSSIANCCSYHPVKYDKCRKNHLFSFFNKKKCLELILLGSFTGAKRQISEVTIRPTKGLVWKLKQPSRVTMIKS